MFNYELSISNGDKVVTKFALERGESRKGTFATISAKAGCAAIPFGKLYVDETKLTDTNDKPAIKANGKAKKS